MDEKKYEKLSYREEDGYLLPNVEVRESTIQYGKYGSFRREFIKEKFPISYMTWLLDGTLDQRLLEVDERTREAVEQMVQHWLEKNTDVPDKMSDPIRYIAFEDNLRKAAEEILLPEMIYS